MWQHIQCHSRTITIYSYQAISTISSCHWIFLQRIRCKMTARQSLAESSLHVQNNCSLTIMKLFSISCLLVNSFHLICGSWISCCAQFHQVCRWPQISVRGAHVLLTIVQYKNWDKKLRMNFSAVQNYRFSTEQFRGLFDGKSFINTLDKFHLISYNPSFKSIWRKHAVDQKFAVKFSPVNTHLFTSSLQSRITVSISTEIMQLNQRPWSTVATRNGS